MADGLSFFMRKIGRSSRGLFSVILVAALGTGQATGAGSFHGRVADAAEAPVAGAMVTFATGQPERATTVFSDAAGRYQMPGLSIQGSYRVHARRIGCKDLVRDPEEAPGQAEAREIDFVLKRAIRTSEEWQNDAQRVGGIWICGTKSDSQGRVGTSTSNLAAWQIEGALPRLIRRDPGRGPFHVANAHREATR